MTPDEARALTDAWRASGEAFTKLGNYLIAWQSDAWRALGYSTFEDYCGTELAGLRIALPVDERRDAVAKLTHAGMSKREISAALRVSTTTVANDRRPVQKRTPTRADVKKHRESTPAPVQKRTDATAAAVLQTEIAASERRQHDSRAGATWSHVSARIVGARDAIDKAVAADPTTEHARAHWAERDPELAARYAEHLDAQLAELIDKATDARQRLASTQTLRRVQ